MLKRAVPLLSVNTISPSFVSEVDWLRINLKTIQRPIPSSKRFQYPWKPSFKIQYQSTSFFLIQQPAHLVL